MSKLHPCLQKMSASPFAFHGGRKLWSWLAFQLRLEESVTPGSRDFILFYDKDSFAPVDHSLHQSTHLSQGLWVDDHVIVPSYGRVQHRIALPRLQILQRPSQNVWKKIKELRSQVFDLDWYSILSVHFFKISLSRLQCIVGEGERE